MASFWIATAPRRMGAICGSVASDFGSEACASALR